jgi:hypothetical protein
MKRYLVILTGLALLALPPLAGADNHGRFWDDTGWLPSWWTPTPPAGGMVDAARLLELLVKKGVITRQEQAMLAQTESAMLAEQGREGVKGSGLGSQTAP